MATPGFPRPCLPSRSCATRSPVTTGLPKVLDLQATVDAVHNVVHLRAKSAGDNVIYYWQMSADGGQTWTDLGKTREPKKSVPGLTRGKPYQFRYRADTSKLSKLWSDPVGVLVP